MHVSPWVHNAAHPDTSSLKRLVQHERFKGLEGEALAVALWKYTVDPVTGFYHFWSPVDLDGGKALHGTGYVNDPLKLINSHGAMLCGTVAAIYANLCEAAGLRARLVGVTGHTLNEAFFDGAWHLMDCDLRAYHRTRDGRSIASLRQLLADPTLVADPVVRSDPYYLADRLPENVAKACYAPRFGDEMPRSVARFHRMDYVLRPGETLTRYAAAHGRWHFPPHWIEDGKKYAAEWKAKGQRERFLPHRTYFNGCFEYEPDLTSASRDLALGAWALENTGTSEQGLTALDPAKPGRAVLLLHSAWIITGIPGDPSDASKKSGAALVEVDVAMDAVRGGGTGEAALLLSLDGANWKEIARVRQGGTLSADLSEELDRRYRALLAVEVKGAAVVKRLRTETWFQHTVNSYPYLAPGETVMRYHGLDDQGRRTLTEPWRPALEDGLWNAVVASANLTEGPTAQSRLAPSDPARPWQAVFRAAPQVLRPRPIVRAWVWASLAGWKGDPDAPDAAYQARRPRARLEAAVAPHGPWTLVAEGEVPIHKQGYHFSLDGDFIPEGGQGVPEIFIRVTSDMPGWETRAALSCEMPVAPSGVPRLEIVHQWKEDGQPREHRHAVRDSSSSFDYRVLAGQGALEDTALIMRVPSSRRTQP